MVYWVDNKTAPPVKPRKNPVSSDKVSWFTDQLGQTPTIPQADWFNSVQSELLGIAEALGITPDKFNDNQLGKGIVDYIASLEPVEKIHLFHTKTAEPPYGYIVRNGQSIDLVKMPKLYARYGSKMPDDRDRVYRMYGELAGEVGTTQEDAIRNIKADIDNNCLFSDDAPFVSGAFSVHNWNGTRSTPDGNIKSFHALDFDASRVVPTALENRVKSRIIIACNKIQ